MENNVVEEPEQGKSGGWDAEGNGGIEGLALTQGLPLFTSTRPGGNPPFSSLLFSSSVQETFLPLVVILTPMEVLFSIRMRCGGFRAWEEGFGLFARFCLLLPFPSLPKANLPEVLVPQSLS